MTKAICLNSRNRFFVLVSRLFVFIMVNVNSHKISHAFISLLFLIANTWEDVTSLKGATLKIGDKSFPSKPSPNPFVHGINSPAPHEVKGSLASLLFLQLQHIHKKSSAPTLLDGGMKIIMDSSKEVTVNTTNMISKANTAFASHFVEQLSMKLYFNDFSTHSRPKKKDYYKFTLDLIAAGIGHNQKILLFYLFKIDESRFLKLFPMGHNRALETLVHKIVRAQFDLTIACGSIAFFFCRIFAVTLQSATKHV